MTTMQNLKNSTSADNLLAFLRSKKADELKSPFFDALHHGGDRILQHSVTVAPQTDPHASQLDAALDFLCSTYAHGTPAANHQNQILYPVASSLPVPLNSTPNVVFTNNIISKSIDLAETFAYAEPTYYTDDAPHPGSLSPVLAQTTQATATRNQSSSDATCQCIPTNEDADTAPSRATTATTTGDHHQQNRPIRRTARQALERLDKVIGRRRGGVQQQQQQQRQHAHEDNIDDASDSDSDDQSQSDSDSDDAHGSTDHRHRLSSRTTSKRAMTPQPRTTQGHIISSRVNTKTKDPAQKTRTLQPKAYDSLITPGLPAEEVRKLRRMLSNRESARRSRKRKAAQISTLEEELQEAYAMIAQLKEELMEVQSTATAMQKRMQSEIVKFKEMVATQHQQW